MRHSVTIAWEFILNEYTKAAPSIQGYDATLEGNYTLRECFTSFIVFQKKTTLIMNEKIGVIVPVYKTEKYIRKCLDSILAQTYTHWEAILVDDGSPDNSGVICDEYAAKDKRFKVIHQ